MEPTLMRQMSVTVDDHGNNYLSLLKHMGRVTACQIVMQKTMSRFDSREASVKIVSIAWQRTDVRNGTDRLSPRASSPYLRDHTSLRDMYAGQYFIRRS